MTTAPTTRRRGRRLRWLVAVLLLGAVLEVLVLLQVARSLGVLWTVALLVGMAVVGAWLARRETGRTYRALEQAVRAGRLPADEATDAMLVLLGAFLLILPGFLTDVVGLVLVLPPTRPAARRLLHALVAARLPAVATQVRTTGRPAATDVVEGEVLRTTPPPGGQEQPPPALGR